MDVGKGKSNAEKKTSESGWRGKAGNGTQEADQEQL